MSMEFVTTAGFILAVFAAGVAAGKLIEKIERFLNEKDHKQNIDHKNNRH